LSDTQEPEPQQEPAAAATNSTLVG